MTEMILLSAAMLLSLLCLIFSIGSRRDPSFRPPHKQRAKTRIFGAAYPAMAGMLFFSSAISAALKLGSFLGVRQEASILRALRLGYCIFHTAFFCFFLFYIAVLTNVFIPPVSEDSGHPGAHAGAPSRGGRRTALLPLVIVLTGAAVQAACSVRVELFFEAVALLCLMILYEQDRAAAGSPFGRRIHLGAVLVAGLAFLAVIAMDMALILDLLNAQTDEIGNTRLSVISGRLQDTITEAQADVQQAAFGAEQLMQAGASQAEITKYFYSQKEKFQSNESFMNVYIAGLDWQIIPDFSGPKDFHASERVWYLGAHDQPGEVFISEPYLDANGGGMCFTVSTELSDGETVVGMDLNFSKAQESILEMTNGPEHNAMIVTSGGLIAGYTDTSLIGERAEEKLPEYAAILRRVVSSREHGSFRVELDGRPCMVFSAETSNGWYLILSVDTGTLYGESYRQIAMMGSVNFLMLAVVVVFFLITADRRRHVKKALTGVENSLRVFSDRLRESAVHLLRLGDIRLLSEEKDPEEFAGHVREYGHQLSILADDLSDCSGMLHRKLEEENAKDMGRPYASAKVPGRRVRSGIVISLLISLVIVEIFCINIASGWGTVLMEREADTYENQLGTWLTRHRSILNMFTSLISSEPQLMEDYDSAVDLLHDISERYPEISACYLANPFAEHTVIMDNGWIPDEAYRPEGRPWYRSAARSADGFSISPPYLDAQTGSYCITLAQVVYGKEDEFLGIFGIDFFLDQLIHVLGESYTSRGYAFLVDSEGTIINHPGEEYQMSGDLRVSVEDTEYADAFSKDKVVPLKDYSGRFMACLTRKTDSGFTVVVTKRWQDIYGGAVLITNIFLVLFGVCIAFIVSLINSFLRWQEHVNHRLVEAAETAQSASRAKSQFLSQMSHEIRTPMNAIIGLDSIALRDRSISQNTRNALEKIGISARHLLSLINDILDMSRIESGRMTLKKESFSLRGLLDQVNVIINGQCEDKGLRYVFRPEMDLDEYFVGDDLKLRQVIINILGNSVKFTDPPGVITFSVDRSDGPDGKDVLHFMMEDTGIGMDKEFIPRLFDAFSMENEGTTTRFGGSGLGMAITKSIVEMMDGEILVESEKGLGTTFTVSVSLERAEDGQTAEAAQLTTVSRSRRKDSEAETKKEGISEKGREADFRTAEQKTGGEGQKRFLQDTEGGTGKRAESAAATGKEAETETETGKGAETEAGTGKGAETEAGTGKGAETAAAAEKKAEIAAGTGKGAETGTGMKSGSEKENCSEGGLPAETEAGSSLDGRHMLIAEDQEMNAEVLTDLLELEGMSSEWAKNGMEAVSLFDSSEEGHFDAILMDMRMPVMDGLAATRKIRALTHPDAARIPIIALTANAFEEDVQQCLQAGMNAHLSKPIDLDLLIDTLTGLLIKK